jgi:serine/threonine protein kinase
VLKILQYLHGLKPPVLHRDIKPNNLILGQDKRVYLVDFGAVQNSAAIEGVTFTVVGTSGYAPLEQFWGQAVAASDLYALGASLIHLLTGISPADLPQLELRIQFRDKVSINSQFLNWIETLTEPDLGLRFKTAFSAIKSLEKGHLKLYTKETILAEYSRINIKRSADNLSIDIPAKPRLLLQDFWFFILKLPPFIGAVLAEVTGKLIRFIVLHIWLIPNKDKDQINQQINQLAARNVCDENSITIINDIKRTSFTCLNSYSLQFDRDWFIFECNRSSLFNLLSHPTTNIQKKDINNTENQEYCQRDKTLCINEITANSSYHQIYIKTIKKIYTINCLSKSECKWIIQEIKKWLYQSE